MMDFDETKTYWSHNGKHEKKLEVLHQLIDDTLIWKKPYRAKMPKAYSGGKNYHLERYALLKMPIIAGITTAIETRFLAEL